MKEHFEILSGTTTLDNECIHSLLLVRWQDCELLLDNHVVRHASHDIVGLWVSRSLFFDWIFLVVVHNAVEDFYFEFPASSEVFCEIVETHALKLT